MPTAETTEWDPEQYLFFASERLRPAVDLLTRVPFKTPKLIYDLGCGTGTQTRLLTARWPEAEITAVDGSAEMLTRAEAETDHPVTWVQADLNDWQSATPVDLIFSNAALHWLDDHAILFPKLLAGLAPGGCLAVQMPDNFAAPSHTGLWEAARQGPWAGALEDLIRTQPVAGPDLYYDWLAPRAERVDVWHTTYWHVLHGPDPVVNWTKGSVLKAFLDRLNAAEAETFIEAYAAKMRAAYPPRPDGTTLFPFRRLFLVAIR